MKQIFNKAIKTKSVSREDLGKLIQYISQPENIDKYYLNNESKTDRIGKYRTLVFNPNDPEKQYKVKLYEIKNSKDPILYKIQYYDIMRDDLSNTKKAMLLYALQKRIEYIYGKELKINQRTGDFNEIDELLEKVKKARSYYSFKMFLNDNKSHTTIKTTKDSVVKAVKK